LSDTVLAITFSLLATLLTGAGFVLTQFALRAMPPWMGAAFSVPTSTLLFWCLTPLTIDLTKADGTAIAIFAAIGVLFPATVTLLNFESNRLMGANITSAVGGVAPVFAVVLALFLLHEIPRLPQLLGLAAIVIGITLMYRRRAALLPMPSFWLLIIPLAAAAVRGGVQPLIKLGFEHWPNPFAAVTIGYTMSAIVLVGSALIRNRGPFYGFDRKSALWFAAVGLCNGLGVLGVYAALGHGPVALVSPIVSSSPLVTVLLGHALLAEEPMNARLIAGVIATIGGVVLLILA
jgi:drug/metabolite transporter (DMT)-like permease